MGNHIMNDPRVLKAISDAAERLSTLRNIREEDISDIIKRQIDNCHREMVALEILLNASASNRTPDPKVKAKARVTA